MLKGIKYCQLSDNDLGMNLPAYTTSYTTKQTDSRSTTNVKGMEKKHNLFVEVNLSNGRSVYIFVKLHWCGYYKRMKDCLVIDCFVLEKNNRFPLLHKFIQILWL